MVHDVFTTEKYVNATEIIIQQYMTTETDKSDKAGQDKHIRNNFRLYQKCISTIRVGVFMTVNYASFL